MSYRKEKYETVFTMKEFLHQYYNQDNDETLTKIINNSKVSHDTLPFFIDDLNEIVNFSGEICTEEISRIIDRVISRIWKRSEGLYNIHVNKFNVNQDLLMELSYNEKDYMLVKRNYWGSKNMKLIIGDIRLFKAPSRVYGKNVKNWEIIDGEVIPVIDCKRNKTYYRIPNKLTKYQTLSEKEKALEKVKRRFYGEYKE